MHYFYIEFNSDLFIIRIKSFKISMLISQFTIMKKSIIRPAILLLFVVLSGTLFAETVTLNPTKDGFVRQVDDSYVGSYLYSELRSATSFCRELFLDYDLSSLTFTPQHATLRLYVNSVADATPFIVSAYVKTGNAITESLVYTNRPTTDQSRFVDIHASQDSVGKWLQFDFSDYIKAQDLSTNKLFYFRIVITNPLSTSPLVTIGSNESASQPQLVLSDAPVNGTYELPYSNIQSITVSTPNTAAGDPINAFNGAGLLPAMCHETSADNKAWRNSSGTPSFRMAIKLNENATIQKFHIWNFNWMSGVTNYSNRGVKDLDIYISSSTDNLNSVLFTDGRWIKVSTTGLTLTQASALVSYAGESVSVTNAKNAKWIGFNMKNNFAASNFLGLSEVKVYKQIETIPYFRSKVSGNWTNKSTWESSTDNTVWIDANEFPATSATSIIIQNGHTVTVTADATASTLTLNSGSIINVNAGKRFSVNTALTNNGTIIIKSDVNGTATLTTPTTISGSGTTNVEQYLTTGRNWYFASPVSGATSNVVSASVLKPLYSYNETNNTWTNITNTTTELDLMKGYVANVASDGVITFSGSLNTGNKSIVVNRTLNAAKAGFNLVGNPYPSHLNWSNVTKTNLETTMWYRTKPSSYYFETYNSTGNVGTNNSGIGVITRYIPPMQAFWVRVSAGQSSGTLSVTNTQRSHDLTTNRLKAPSESSNNQKLLRLQVSNGTNNDQAIILFNSNAENDYDAYDSPKMSNANPTIPELFTTVSGERMVINGLKNMESNPEIALGFSTGESNSFSISANEISNFETGTKLILRDKLLSKEVELNNDTQYSFTSEVASTENRFSILVKAPSSTTNVINNNDGEISIYRINNEIVVSCSDILNGENLVTVHTIVGSRLFAEKINSSYTKLNTTFASGIYLVTVKNGAKSITKKIVIQN